MQVNITSIIQILSIVASSLGIYYGFTLFQYSGNLERLINSLFVLFFCILLLFVEIYIFPFFRFFGFLLKPWGKGVTYLILSFFINSRNQNLFEQITQISFWVLAGIYIIFTFASNGIAKPLLQQNTEIHLTTNQKDYFMA